MVNSRIQVQGQYTIQNDYTINPDIQSQTYFYPPKPIHDAKINTNDQDLKIVPGQEWEMLI